LFDICGGFTHGIPFKANEFRRPPC
jgi:hypothetical protein